MFSKKEYLEFVFKKIYDDLNKEYFENILPNDMIIKFDNKYKYSNGRTDINNKYIFINYDYVFYYGIKDNIINTLKHEMLHHYLYIKGLNYEDDNKLFIKCCKKFRIK